MNNSAVKESFLNLFHLLTPTQKKVWKVLHWFARHFRAVFPSQAKLAAAARCCRDSVVEAVKKFVELGWLGTIRRGYQSNVYFMNDELIGIDPNKSGSFKKPQPKQASSEGNPTTNPTVLKDSNNEYIEHTQQQGVGVQHLEMKKQQAFPREIRDLPIPEDAKRAVSRFSPRIFQLALEDCRTYAKLHRITNLPGLLLSRCKAYYDKFRMEAKK